MNKQIQQTISPIDGTMYAERELATYVQIESALAKSVAAQHEWKHVSVAERVNYLCDIAEQELRDLAIVDHDQVAEVIKDARINFVAFTGSVAGGHAVQRAANERFIATGLELGGKDPAYVRAG